MVWGTGLALYLMFGLVSIGILVGSYISRGFSKFFLGEDINPFRK